MRKASSSMLAAIIIAAVAVQALFMILSSYRDNSIRLSKEYVKYSENLQKISSPIELRLDDGQVIAYSSIPLNIVGSYIMNKSSISNLRLLTHVVTPDGAILTDKNTTDLILNGNTALIILEGGKLITINNFTLQTNDGQSTPAISLSPEYASIIPFAIGTIYNFKSTLSPSAGPEYSRGAVHPKWFFTLSTGINHTVPLDLSPSEEVLTTLDVEGPLYVNNSFFNVSCTYSSPRISAAFIGVPVEYSGVTNFTVKISFGYSTKFPTNPSYLIASLVYYVLPHSSRLDYPINPVPYISNGILNNVPLVRHTIKTYYSGSVGANSLLTDTVTVVINLNGLPPQGYIVIGCELLTIDEFTYYQNTLLIS